MADTKAHAEKGPVERLADKVAQSAAADDRLNKTTTSPQTKGTTLTLDAAEDIAGPGPSTDTVGRKASNPAHSLPSEETAVVNAKSQTEDPSLKDRLAAARGDAVVETTESKGINIGQGENANGEAQAKVDFSEASFSTQGGTKITREAGDENTGKPAAVDVVQQGGGGVVNAATGAPVAGQVAAATKSAAEKK